MAEAEITIEEFTDEVTTFLDANCERKESDDKPFTWGEGREDVNILEEQSREQELAELEKGKAWRAKRFDAGLGWISGPEEHGGRELPGAYDRLYARIEGEYTTPNMSPFGIGLGMVAPTILAHGTEVVRDAYLAKMYRGDLVGCQLFSGPGAGRTSPASRPAPCATATSGS